MTSRKQAPDNSLLSNMLSIVVGAWLLFALFLTTAGIYEWYQFASDPIYRAEILRIRGWWNYETPTLYVSSLMNLIIAGTIFSLLGFLTLWKRGVLLITSNILFVLFVGTIVVTPADEIVGRFIATVL